MTKPSKMMRVDTRDYEVHHQFHVKTTRAVVTKDGVSMDVDQLSAKYGVCSMTLRRRLRAMVCWDELVSDKRGRTYDMLMPSIKDTLTDKVNWAVFGNNRDYTVDKGSAIGKGDSSLYLTYKGESKLVSALATKHAVSYATVRKRIETGRSYADVFSSDRMSTDRADLSDLPLASFKDARSMGEDRVAMLIKELVAANCGFYSVVSRKSKMFQAQNSGPLYMEPMLNGGGV